MVRVCWLALAALFCPAGAKAQVLLEPKWEPIFSTDVETGPIRDMAFTPSGELVVLDDEGVEVFRWGGRGGGPGELIDPIAVAVSSNGTVAVADAEGVDLFGLSGDLIEGYPVDGQAIPVTVVFGPADEPLALILNLLHGSSVVRLSDGESLWETVAESVAMGMFPRFSPRPLMAGLADGRVAVGEGKQYHLTVLDAQLGTVVGGFSRPINAREISPGFEARVRDYLANPERAPSGWVSVVGDGQRSVPAALLAMLQFPDAFPMYRDAFLGPNGSLWVRRGMGVDDELSQPVEPPDGHLISFDLFDTASQEYQGTVIAPDGLTPIAGDETRVAAIDTGLIPAIRVFHLRF